MMNEYFVKIEPFHEGKSLGVQCFILNAKNGMEAVKETVRIIDKKYEPAEITKELIDVHRL